MHTYVIRIIAVVALLASSISAVAALPVLAQDSEIGVGDIVSTDEEGVNLREQSDTGANVVTTLPIFASLEIIDGPETGDGYTWWKVEILDEDSVDQGLSGWVAEEFLTLDDVKSPPGDDPTPTATATPDEGEETPEPTATATANPDESEFELAGWVEVVDGPVNLRADAGTDADILGTIATGETATVVEGSSLKTANSYEWINVTARGGDEGWLATAFLDPLTNDPCANDGCVPDEDQALLDAPSVEVIDGPVNVRADGSLDAEVLATAATGTLLSVADPAESQLADGHTWLSIDFQGDVLWVATDFVSASDESCENSPCPPASGEGDSPFASALGIEVVDGPVNVRSSPGLDGEIVTTLSTGYTGQVDSRQPIESVDGYDWIAIITGERDSWVATDFLDPLNEVPCIDGTCYPEALVPFFGATGAIVVEGPLNLRANPDTGADILMMLENGDYLWIVSTLAPDPYEADGYLWIEVTVAGEIGFVAIDYVEPAE